MDLTTAIKHILDGDSIILMGAGASDGAKMPSEIFLLAQNWPRTCMIYVKLLQMIRMTYRMQHRRMRKCILPCC